MAAYDEKTRHDSVRLYHTGAATLDDPQPDPDASLGGLRSSTEADLLAYEPFNLVNGIHIEYISGAAGIGDGRLESVDGESLRFWAPGGAPGAITAIADGETKLIEDANSQFRFVRCRRYLTDEMVGETLVKMGRRFNNVVGMSNVSDAERAAGEEKVRAIALYNEAVESIEDLELWIDPLAEEVTTDVAQLPASGVGTIETSEDISLWPRWGWHRIEQASTTLREIVFGVTHPEDKEIEVIAANHRGLLGTSASAGSATDTIRPVPGLRIDLEDPPFSVAATENDLSQLGGLTWSSAIRKGDGPSRSSLASGSQVALWIRLSIPAIAGSSFAVDWAILNSLGISYFAA